jgi:hypothetical protein
LQQSRGSPAAAAAVSVIGSAGVSASPDAAGRPRSPAPAAGGDRSPDAVLSSLAAAARPAVFPAGPRPVADCRSSWISSLSGGDGIIAVSRAAARPPAAFRPGLPHRGGQRRSSIGAAGADVDVDVDEEAGQSVIHAARRSVCTSPGARPLRRGSRRCPAPGSRCRTSTSASLSALAGTARLQA